MDIGFFSYKEEIIQKILKEFDLHGKICEDSWDYPYLPRLYYTRIRVEPSKLDLLLKDKKYKGLLNKINEIYDFEKGKTIFLKK